MMMMIVAGRENSPASVPRRVIWEPRLLITLYLLCTSLSLCFLTIFVLTLVMAMGWRLDARRAVDVGWELSRREVGIG